MRILFIHAALNGLTAEYKVHKTFVDNMTGGNLEALFIWQNGPQFDQQKEQVKTSTSRIIYQDFGRNMAISPRPSRFQRAGMMLKRLPAGIIQLLKTAHGFKPDVVYSSQQSFDLFLARIVCRFLKIPHVVHLHYSIGPWLGRSTMKILRSTANMIAISEFVRQTAILRGIDPLKVTAIPNIIDIQYYQRPVDRLKIRHEFHWFADEQVIITVGRLDPMKGHLILINAFAHVVQKCPGARLLICGESTTRKGFDRVIKNRVAYHHLEPYVSFAGYRSDIPELLKSADIFCLPTELEPAGLVFLEAMAAGLPVVALHSGGVPEIVLHQNTGLLSYPNHPLKLAENLISLLSDSQYAHRLGKNGKKRVEDQFDPKKLSCEWLNELTQIISNKE